MVKPKSVRRAVKAGAIIVGAVKEAMRTKKRTSTKTRTATKVVTRRRRRGEVAQGTAEYSRQNVVIGRKPRQTLKGAWKLLNQNINSVTWYLNAYSQMFGTSGAVRLLNTSTTATTGVLTAPCHLYDLTASPNGIAGTIINPFFDWVPTFTDQATTGGLLNWIQPASRQWQIQDSDTNATAYETYPGGECTLDYIQAKLLFYAPLSFPCKYNIQVVQFTDDRFVPGNNGTAEGIAPNQYNVQTAFWKSMTKKYMHSPLEDGEGKFMKYVKVLYQNEFILNPKESTESVNTIFRQVNIFMRLNRGLKYDWNDDSNMVMTTEATTTNNSNQVETTVLPKKRIFLMIRAMARNGTTYSNTVHPSYDVVLKKKQSPLAS